MPTNRHHNVLVAVTALLLRATSLADCPGRWLPGLGLPGVDGEIHAMITDNNASSPVTYIGGSFSIGGLGYASNIASWDGAALKPLGAGLPGPVDAVTIWAGDLIAAGEFADYPWQPYLRRWNGSNWYDVEYPLDFYINSMAEFDGALCVGGVGTVAAEERFNHLARWDGQAWTHLGAGLNGPVNSLTAWNGALIAGGSFSTNDFNPAPNVAQWTGANWIGMASGLDDVVQTLTVLNGDLVAGGRFKHSGRLDARYAARWTESGWVAVGAASPPPGPLTALTVLGGSLFGLSSSSNGTELVQNIGDYWSIIPDRFMAYYAYGTPQALVSSGNELLIGGSFAFIDRMWFHNLARWRPDEPQTWLPPGPGFSGPVFALAPLDGHLVIGGQFNAAGGIPASNIVGWDGISWSALGIGVEYYGVLALLVHGGQLIAGGGFESADGVPAAGVAAWDGEAWQPFGAGAPNQVFALSEFAGELVAAGDISTPGRSTPAGVAHWDGQAWQNLGDFPYSSGTALAIYGDKLIAAGEGPWIGQWDGARWEMLGSWAGGSASCGIDALAVYHGDLIAAGDFDHAGSTPAANVARWDGSAWIPLDGGLSESVSALALFGEELLAASTASSSSGVSTSIFAWDGVRWSIFAAGVGGRVNTISVIDGQVFVGGDFLTVGGNVSPYMARWGIASAVCAADLNGDGFVDLGDLAALLGCYGSGTCGDVDCNGTTDLSDLVEMLNQWSKSCR